MLKIELKFSLIIFLLFIQTISICQNRNDSIIKMSYDDLRQNIRSDLDFSTTNKYANAYFNKAKIEKDSLQMAFGYYYRAIVNNDDNVKLDFYDSIIKISRKFKNEIFPAIAYFNEGIYYYEQQNYSEALDNYVKASYYNNGSKKEEMSFYINSSISQLKLRIEENEEALLILKKSWRYVINNDLKQSKQSRYFNTLFNLANAHRKLNHIDSSKTYTRLGIIDSKSAGHEYYHNLFKFLEGVLSIEYDVDNSVNNLRESLLYMIKEDKKINIALAYQYLGKAYLKKGKHDNAIANFKKVDSIIEKEKLLLPELLASLNYIKNHYSKTNQPKLELEYINKILRFDSIFNLNYRFINNKIKNEYEIPILLNEREIVISELKHRNIKKTYLTYGLGLIIIITLFILFIQIYLRKKYAKRFKFLIANNENYSTSLETNHLNIGIKDSFEKEKMILDIPVQVVENIINKIISFENNKEYLNNTINSSTFAKSIGTNNSYFTKVFKYYKKVSFSIYLKDLRLEYSFEKIKKDYVFRKYTIRAIAIECGFNNPESFSKGFYKKYGVYPSYFIKKIEKEELS